MAQNAFTPKPVSSPFEGVASLGNAALSMALLGRRAEADPGAVNDAIGSYFGRNLFGNAPLMSTLPLFRG